MINLNLSPMTFGLSYRDGLLDLDEALALHFEIVLGDRYDKSYIGVAKQAIHQFEQGNPQKLIKRYVHEGDWKHESSHTVNEAMNELNLHSFLNHMTVAETMRWSN